MVGDALAFVGFWGWANKTQSNFLSLLEFVGDIKNTPLRFGLTYGKFIYFSGSNHEC